MTLGDTLKKLLRERGTTYSKAAELAGIDQSAISRLCNGERMPNRETVAALVAGLRLKDDEAERLYTAAGYVAPGMMVVAAGGELEDAARILGDSAIPEVYRNGLRRQIAAAVGITRDMAAAS